MEGINNKGGDIVVVVQDQLDMGDGMQCSDHPYTSNPGGICAFCLQDKLGKLVSSSFPPLRVSAASSSSSSSPSFRSDLAAAPSSSTSLSLSLKANAEKQFRNNQEYCTRSATMSFLLARKTKKKKVGANEEDMVFKRSKSTTTPRTTRQHFVDASSISDEFATPRKRNGFWSFLYHQQHKASSKNKLDSSKISSSSSFANPSATTTTVTAVNKSLGASSMRNRTQIETTETEKGEDDVSSTSPNSQATTASSFERKVSRSRSVGCGSRSFAGDFFERISTGFGDCSTLRRVESQREGKPNHKRHSSSSTERVKCGGLFSGFMMTSSSSSSSYWVSSSANEDVKAGKAMTSARSGRRSWGSWAFASPMRAFSKPSSSSSSKDGKIRRANNNASDKNTTPNLSAIPSLLSVR